MYRRAFVRSISTLPAAMTCSDGVSTGGVLRNLSLGGALFDGECVAPVGAEVVLTFIVPPTAPACEPVPVRARARVMRHQPLRPDGSGGGTGLLFTGLGLRESEAMADLVEHYLRVG